MHSRQRCTAHPWAAIWFASPRVQGRAWRASIGSGRCSPGPLVVRRPLQCTAQLLQGGGEQGASEGQQQQQLQQQWHGGVLRLPPQLRFLHLGNKPIAPRDVSAQAAAGGPPGSGGGAAGGGGGGGGGDEGGSGKGDDGKEEPDTILSLKEVGGPPLGEH